jgi:CheY-like chemotaxis protein
MAPVGEIRQALIINRCATALWTPNPPSHDSKAFSFTSTAAPTISRRYSHACVRACRTELGMSALNGLRVLIVEDEALIAMMAEDMIDSLGCVVAGIAGTIADAHTTIIEIEFDVAILDVNLNGNNSMGLATTLKQRGTPFAFTTGYGADGIDTEHRDMPVLTKPYSIADLETALQTCAARCQLAGTSSTTSITDSNRG